MDRKIDRITFVGVLLAEIVLISLMLSAMASAGPIPPAEKLTGDDSDGLPPVTTKWYLRNGAFDETWDGDVPTAWQVYPGDADAYGSLGFLDPEGGELEDDAFVFQIINDEVKSDRNAYLFQELALPEGDYWINVHSSIYGTGEGSSRYSGQDARNAYTYVAYYALVPKAEVTRRDVFAPELVDAGDWKELWPWSAVCSEDIKGWQSTGQPNGCDYVKRAETVRVAGGDYLFILRAELKWPDFRAFAYYIFDDIQVIAATPFRDNWNACVTNYCLEGILKR